MFKLSHPKPHWQSLQNGGHTLPMFNLSCVVLAPPILQNPVPLINQMANRLNLQILTKISRFASLYPPSLKLEIMTRGMIKEENHLALGCEIVGKALRPCRSGQHKQEGVGAQVEDIFHHSVGKEERQKPDSLVRAAYACNVKNSKRFWSNSKIWSKIT